MIYLICLIALFFAVIIRKPAKEYADTSIELLEWTIENHCLSVIKQGSQIPKKKLHVPLISDSVVDKRPQTIDFHLINIIQRGLFFIALIVLLTISIHTMADSAKYLQNESLQNILQPRINALKESSATLLKPTEVSARFRFVKF